MSLIQLKKVCTRATKCAVLVGKAGFVAETLALKFSVSDPNP